MKKNMRKVAALGLCVALAATMLTACGGSKGEEKDTEDSDTERDDLRAET